MKMRYIKLLVLASLVSVCVGVPWSCQDTPSSHLGNCNCSGIDGGVITVWCPSNIQISIDPVFFESSRITLNCNSNLKNVSALPNLRVGKVRSYRLNFCNDHGVLDSEIFSRLGVDISKSTSGGHSRRGSSFNCFTKHFSSTQNVRYIDDGEPFYSLIPLTPEFVMGLVKKNNITSSTPIGICFNYKNISLIDPRVFHDLIHLLDLSIVHSQLTGLPEQLFRDNRQLTYLTLSYNLLSNITSEHLERLDSLEELDLRHNRLTRLGGDPWRLPALRRLDLSHNHLTSLGDGEQSVLSRLRSLKELNLDNNKLTQLYTDWKDLYNLELVNLYQNMLMSLKAEDLAYQSPSTRMILVRNNIKKFTLPDRPQVPVKMFGLENKVTLLLRDNPLACDCHMYRTVKALANNSIRFQDISGLHIFVDVIDMYHTNCRSPNIKSHPIMSIPLDQLTCPIDDGCPPWCDCYYQPEGSYTVINCTGAALPQSVPRHPDSKHTKVILADTPLGEFNVSTASWMDQVTELDLRNTSLRNFHVSEELRNLKVLDLSYNQLTSLSPKTLDSLKYLQTVSLNHNPWSCACPDLEFVRFATKKVKMLNNKDTYCQNGTLVQDLLESELCPNRCVCG